VTEDYHIPPEWNLGDWEKALTIQVGTAYLCRECGNIVMVTRGGAGILDLVCCDKPMEKVEPPTAGETP
jgi:desulfoferrodoxin-like iron-binding protein